VAAKKPETDAKPQTVKLDERGQLVITLDADYVLRPSEEAILEAERETGLALFDLASLAANSRLRLEQMGILVSVFMRAHGVACPQDPLITTYRNAKPESLAKLIYEAGIPRIMGGLTVLLAGAINGAYTASGEAKPAS
jgi:hypothetical protein